MKVATRVATGVASYAADLTYFMPNNADQPVHLTENTALVDGIGGTTWSGALVLAALLDGALAADCSLVELGCGTGVAGIAAALGNASAVTAALLTDQEVDLAADNVQRAAGGPLAGHVGAHCLPWGEGREGEALAALAALSGRHEDVPSVVLCAEVACLIKRQDRLVATIDALAGPRTVVLVTFDDDVGGTGPTAADADAHAPGAAPTRMSKYEAQFIERMRALGFLRAAVCAGRVHWTREGPGASDAYLEAVPSTDAAADAAAGDLDCRRIALPALPCTGGGPASGAGAVIAIEQHRVTCFFRPAATSVCARCTRLFFPCFNHGTGTTGCQHHSGFFVCRKHPAEVRCSIDGAGDALGYYGTGTEGYEATFWDCCGSEDPAHPGCVVTTHEAY